jgi:hypothetical protein
VVGHHELAVLEEHSHVQAMPGAGQLMPVVIVPYSSDHPTRCPGCDTMLDGHLSLPVPDRPKPDRALPKGRPHVTVCRFCGQCMVYTERNGRLALRRPNLAEKHRLLERPDITAEMFFSQLREDDITGGWPERG